MSSLMTVGIRFLTARLTVMLWPLLVLGASGLLGCSSAPEKNYQVSRHYDLSVKFMAMADRQRQLGFTRQATDYYRQAEHHALQRNDKILVGLAQLKRAAMAIDQGALTAGQGLLEQVRLMNDIEQLALAPAIDFIAARLAYHQGETPQAMTLLAGLQLRYQDDPEKLAYYQLQGWVYQRQSLSVEQVAERVAMLQARYQSGQLDNVEIYSFALYQQAEYLAQSLDPQAFAAIELALQHFSSLELSNKIRQCYQMAAGYFLQNGQIKRAEYYQQQAERLNPSIP